MEKELSLGNPILKCYQKGRFITMMLSQLKNTLPWIYYSNMQICCHKLNEKREPFVIDVCNSVAPFLTKEWDACPYIHDNSYSLERINEKYRSITEYIIECINHQEYVHFCVNTDYIKAYSKKKYRKNGMHDIFISGYDLQSKCVIAYDYFQIDYEKKYIPFNEIEDATSNLYKCDGIDDYVGGIHSLSLQEPSKFSLYSADCINIKNIVRKMYEIKNPESSEVNNLMKVRAEGDSINLFGLKVYDEFVQYLSLEIIENQFDYRPFYVIKDHLQIIHNAIEYFSMPYLEESGELLEISTQLALIALKMWVCRKYDNRERLITYVKNIKNMEKDLIDKILAYYKFI